MTVDVGVDLFWLPLGAGGRVVRWNGKVYESLQARLRGRPVTDLYHSALRVTLPDDWCVVEMTPVWAAPDRPDRGVVVQGAVGARWLAGSRWFQYEVHSSVRGSIGDVGEAVDSPVRLTSDETTCRRLLAVLPQVPGPVWGRDELGTGEMWNSNSVISWVLSRSGVSLSGVRPPAGGSAPGWRAGLVVAARQRVQEAAPAAGQGPFAAGSSGSTSVRRRTTAHAHQEAT